MVNVLLCKNGTTYLTEDSYTTKVCFDSSSFGSLFIACLLRHSDFLVTFEAKGPLNLFEGWT